MVQIHASAQDVKMESLIDLHMAFDTLSGKQHSRKNSCKIRA
jgi:hypothetical protein